MEYVNFYITRLWIICGEQPKVATSGWPLIWGCLKDFHNIFAPAAEAAMLALTFSAHVHRNMLFSTLAAHHVSEMHA